MATKKLSEAAYVARGYGQVEPQHLAAPFTGQIYAQLPADPSIDVLENGMFAKYDYVHGVVTFGEATGLGTNGTDTEDSLGEWMLVLNEINTYKERESFEDYAMIKEFYNTRIYSPLGQHDSTINKVMDFTGEAFREGTNEAYTTGVPNFNYWETMPKNTTMVPRLFKTEIGDVFTTNTIDETTLAVGDLLVPTKGTGYLKKATSTTPATETMRWAVVKVYTLPNNLPAVRLQRVA